MIFSCDASHCAHEYAAIIRPSRPTFTTNEATLQTQSSKSSDLVIIKLSSSFICFHIILGLCFFLNKRRLEVNIRRIAKVNVISQENFDLSYNKCIYASLSLTVPLCSVN